MVMATVKTFTRLLAPKFFCKRLMLGPPSVYFFNVVLYLLPLSLRKAQLIEPCREGSAGQTLREIGREPRLVLTWMVSKHAG